MKKTVLTVHATLSPGQVGATETLYTLETRDRAFGLASCGYHYFIPLAGGVYKTSRPLSSSSPHDEPGLAKVAISVVLSGGTDKAGEVVDNFTEYQRDAFGRLYADMRVVLGIELEVVSTVPEIGAEVFKRWIK